MGWRGWHSWLRNCSGKRFGNDDNWGGLGQAMVLESWHVSFW